MNKPRYGIDLEYSVTNAWYRFGKWDIDIFPSFRAVISITNDVPFFRDFLGFDYKRLLNYRFRLQTITNFLRPITIDFKIRIFSSFDYKRLLGFRFRLQTTTVFLRPITIDYKICRFSGFDYKRLLAFRFRLQTTIHLQVSITND